ncbi:DNA topoisomerase I [Caldiplasma sukawensis]
MEKTLIISEKADAGRRIAYFLSDGKSKQKRSKTLNYIEYEGDDGFILVPLSGHIVEIDFPDKYKDWKYETIRDIVESNIVVKIKNKTAYESLREMGKKAKRIVVATDYDREGELIGTEALEIIKKESGFNGEILRAKFSALTAREIKEAFSNFINVDYNLSDSAAAREEIDLYWGVALTRYFSVITGRMGKDFISIGRVQTPTLAIIVEREREIENFVPEKFWEIKAVFSKGGNFIGTNEKGRFKNKEEAESILSGIKGKNGVVEHFLKEMRKIYKPAPFNTTEFLREVARIGVSPGIAMKIAESLYVRGLISYPRTDNTVYQKSINLKSVVEKLKNSEFSEEASMVLSQKAIYPSRGKVEATDHPPIYPTDVPGKEKLSKVEMKVYELIVRRFLATLYKEGEREHREAKISINGEIFITEGSHVTDPGWLSIYKYRTYQDVYHPDLNVGEVVKVVDSFLEEGETKPPSRYDAGSLIKEMENLNLGTKSTRHEILDKLQTRGFIEGNPLRPTQLGRALIDGIKTADSKIYLPDMTAELEVEMDRIAAGGKKKSEVVDESRIMLKRVLEELDLKKSEIKSFISNALNSGIAVGTCKKHEKKVIAVKIRDYFRFKCEADGCYDFYQKIRGLPKETGEYCPVCGAPLVNVIRRGQSPEKICIDKSCSFNEKRLDVGVCPDDGGTLVIRQSKYGKRFLGCKNYPKCKKTYSLPQKGEISFTGKFCPHCNSPILEGKIAEKTWEFCPTLGCKFNGSSNKIKENSKETSKKKTTNKSKSNKTVKSKKGVKQVG